MIFKFALKSDSEHIIEALRIIIAIVLLSIYVYLNGKAEGMLRNNREKKKLV